MAWAILTGDQDGLDGSSATDPKSRSGIGATAAIEAAGANRSRFDRREAANPAGVSASSEQALTMSCDALDPVSAGRSPKFSEPGCDVWIYAVSRRVPADTGLPAWPQSAKKTCSRVPAPSWDIDVFHLSPRCRMPQRDSECRRDPPTRTAVEIRPRCSKRQVGRRAGDCWFDGRLSHKSAPTATRCWDFQFGAGPTGDRARSTANLRRASRTSPARRWTFSNARDLCDSHMEEQRSPPALPLLVPGRRLVSGDDDACLPTAAAPVMSENCPSRTHPTRGSSTGTRSTSSSASMHSPVGPPTTNSPA